MSSAGNTRGLIEARSASHCGYVLTSSAGNTRGLIEAHWHWSTLRNVGSLPRGIPAASLKHKEGLVRLRRGLWSSAGNTRGLIEARRAGRPSTPGRSRLPRGIPAASLKRQEPWCRHCAREGLPRGIPAASLKHSVTVTDGGSGYVSLPRGIPAASLKQHRPDAVHPPARVFRGEYPRPH